MKSGWSEVPLSKVADLRPNKREVRQSATDEMLVSFVPMDCLNAGDRNLASHETRSLTEVYKSYTYFRDGDILLAKITPCFENGKLGVARELKNGIGFGSSEFFVIRPGREILSDYIYYYLHQERFRDAGKQVMTGAVGHKRVPREFLKAHSIPLPPPEEQRRIVAVLDEAFEGLERAHANTKANVQASQELFECELATVFKGIELHAERRCLGDAATEFGRGRSRHRPRNDPRLYGGEVPFIQTGDVRNCDGYILDYSQTYNNQGIAQSKLWPEGTVCITIAANIAETGILGFDACFPDSVIGMVCDRQVTFPEYVEFMLRYFAADLKAQGKGSAQDNINLGTFERSPLPFPPLEQQHQVVNRLRLISNEIVALRKGFNSNLSDFDDLRQSLLQRAFAGELT